MRRQKSKDKLEMMFIIEERIAANKRLAKYYRNKLNEQRQAQSRISAIKQQIELEGESTDLKNHYMRQNVSAISAKVTGLKSEQLTNENFNSRANWFDQTFEKVKILNIEQQRFNERIEDEALKLEKLKEIYNQEAQLELNRLNN